MAANGGKKLTVYKQDNWNMMNIHMHGRRYVVSEISSVEGELTYDFDSKYEMLRWAERRFNPANWAGGSEEANEILAKFKQA